ncbi:MULTISPECIES: alpha/beta hydrolase [Marinomonas]|uniref:Peptidase S9 prolyl oligopeptidase active site domain protein n=2 Tax=Marinomonas TaxID=28253 RepID=F2K0X3_MARM1|nr:MULTISPECIES: alpha/beta hydrolase [Marinomonas]ADZ93322.1 peptidase S9 prolyl oligopeptidase active site domain protein [Marinomonas mediterranea MMB-1]TDO97526.1 acetyl esterase/lipase [Marinomonas balearica]WCN11211.1 alpha/beta hydrolase fold domain-containing protein [Marinomonas mediterranea]WCN15273.1 alpha/beta hydrolase fold domain-containing protein [Marinomonas mediterranea]WCN19319.1 alpha/beta hydrolase fold domain-containing protein [Marinomonas mediterranea MMB-1]
MNLAEKVKKITIGLTMLGAFSGAVQAMELIKDVTYGERTRNQLDIYLPDTMKAEKPPVVVFIHGGRWFRNDKTQFELYNRVPQVTDAGYAVVAINYTYSSEDIWPTQLHDLRDAFDFVRANGDKYGYDADRMAVWGQSSGAHLALWAAFDQAQNPETQLDALVSWYAPSDLISIIPDRANDDVPDRGNMAKEPTPESLLVGKPVPENKALADAASPYRFLMKLPLSTPLPPSLLVHGAKDFVISPLQTERLYNEMKKRSGVESVELRRVKEGKHGGDAFNAEVPAVIEFLNNTFEM